MGVRRLSTASMFTGEKSSKVWNQVTSTRVPAQSAEILMIAGGGNATGRPGGGAGGVVNATGVNFANGVTYTVVVGAGGTATTQGSIYNGGYSVVKGGSLSLTTALGGGGSPQPSGTHGPGATGGSGGGSREIGSSTTRGGYGTSGQGNNGGEVGGGGTEACSGGGGAGGAGASSYSPDPGVAGGAGTSTYSTWATATGTGVSGYYAGGGGSAGFYTNQNGGSGGSGGGGNGGGYGGGSPTRSAGTANTGGGAGGNPYSTGVAGGSGLVIIRWATSGGYSDPVTTGSPTFVTSGSYRYCTFTGSGTVKW